VWGPGPPRNKVGEPSFAARVLRRHKPHKVSVEPTTLHLTAILDFSLLDQVGLNSTIAATNSALYVTNHHATPDSCSPPCSATYKPTQHLVLLIFFLCYFRWNEILLYLPIHRCSFWFLFNLKHIFVSLCMYNQWRTQKLFMGGFHSVAQGSHLYLVCAVCDVTKWRHSPVSKPTFWRSLLT